MNSPLMNRQSGELESARPEERVATLKLIAFTLGNLHLALRIESVYKILARTPVYGSGINQIGVTHIGDREITVVDLYRQFFKSSQSHESDHHGYLVTLQNTTGELYGIPVAETPTLMEVALPMVRVLPESYRCADTLEVARHVAVIPHDGVQLTVFLLDVDLLLPIFESPEKG
ncbi:MAG TPA: chemotaxis protein CheW [Cyanobacteria bacterium UBA8803]|nr:chemotaxis protein CheW [Cyanobacteria bacterium UBA9273]HBL60333.1 chemotaxis protein CheW [Cyanobacteria bacterium UBA8803]